MTFDVNFKPNLGLGEWERRGVGHLLFLRGWLDNLFLPLSFYFRHFGRSRGTGFLKCYSLGGRSFGALPDEWDLYLGILRLG